MVSEAQIGALAIRPLVAGLRDRGVDLTAYFGRFGIDPAVADSADGRIPLKALDALWERAAEESGDEDFGLHAARAVTAGSFGVVSYLGTSSRTLGEALDRLSRYFCLLSDASEYRVETEGGCVQVLAFQYLPVTGPVRQRVEFTVAVLFHYCRRHVVGNFRVDEVHFEHPPPSSTREHERVFGVAPRFGQSKSGLCFENSWLARPLESADPALTVILEAFARRILDEAPHRGSVSQALRVLLLKSGLDLSLSLADVAKMLSMSSRTLQRRLREEGATHHAIVDEMRRSVALRMLGQPTLAIAEAAFATGFSDPAAFHRAFKRWTGTTPAEYRRRRCTDHPGLASPTPAVPAVSPRPSARRG